MAERNYHLIPSPHPAGGRWVYPNLQAGPQVMSVHLGKSFQTSNYGSSFMVQGYADPVRGLFENSSPIFPRIRSMADLVRAVDSIYRGPEGKHLEVVDDVDRKQILLPSMGIILENHLRNSPGEDFRRREYAFMRDAAVEAGALLLEDGSFQSEDGSITTSLDDEGWIVVYGSWE